VGASVASIRIGTVADAEPIAALAIQVFLDTYAPDGVRPDLANEAFAEYGRERFEQRLMKRGRTFYLAELGTGLIGFAEILCASSPSPIPGIAGSELVRLYVQPQTQGSGLGRELIRQAEACAEGAGAGGLWLSAWEGNTHALGFYRHLGYKDAGLARYIIQGRPFGNRIFHKHVGSSGPVGSNAEAPPQHDT
jgi:ribosomal protein S18 acetylase RimI-like enzyme